jgi:hypothetical protein
MRCIATSASRVRTDTFESDWQLSHRSVRGGEIE